MQRYRTQAAASRAITPAVDGMINPGIQIQQ